MLDNIIFIEIKPNNIKTNPLVVNVDNDNYSIMVSKINMITDYNIKPALSINNVNMALVPGASASVNNVSKISIYHNFIGFVKGHIDLVLSSRMHVLKLDENNKHQDVCGEILFSDLIDYEIVSHDDQEWAIFKIDNENFDNCGVAWSCFSSEPIGLIKSGSVPLIFDHDICNVIIENSNYDMIFLPLANTVINFGVFDE